MSLSTSSSDAVHRSAEDPHRGAARSWLVIFLVSGAICFLGPAAFIVGADPFDSGRLALLKVDGVVEERAGFASASRARDLGFDAAVIGNSHAQLLDPERLSKSAGWSFVQLSVSGAAQPEQEAIAGSFFVHHHGAAVAMLFVLDEFWCAPTLSSGVYPFPLWLYGGIGSYLSNLVSADNLSKAVQRVGLSLRMVARTRRDGYEDFELMRHWDLDRATSRVAGDAPRMDGDVGAPLPGVDRLRHLLAQAGAGSRFVLLWTPYYINAIPIAGSPAERRLDECKRGYAAVAAERADTAVVDWRVSGPLAADVGNFWDRTHYRGFVAQMLESDVAPHFAR